MIPKLERIVLEVCGSCNYTCQMCPQTLPGRDKGFKRVMPLSLFEQILDTVALKYGKPQINLEGSGEATMVKKLPQYIEACTKRGLTSFLYTNAFNMRGMFMRDCVDAGLKFIRFSVIGYNRGLYEKWMDADNFFQVRENAIDMQEYIYDVKSPCLLSSYHLILDNSHIEYEIDQYRKNFIEPAESQGYIWKMHNWSGNYAPGYSRKTTERRSCGRPFSPELTIRAGGTDGHRGAVTSCCQTLGPPNEIKSVMGHLDAQSIEDIWFGEPYEKLREAHRREDFDSIDYCKNCDFLYEDPEVLVWSNDSTASTYHMLGTNFNLLDKVEYSE